MFFGIPPSRFVELHAPVRVFLSLAHAFHNSVPIVRPSKNDKEYHFQNWVKRRIEGAGLQYKELSRHGYPDFVLVDGSCGFEVKGLAFPGREADFDCNSQLPLASKDGCAVYYIFGRYPATKDEEFEVHDLVLCSAAFLNAETENQNTNQSFRGAGSYGDILIRDRRMYVCATPYALASNTEAQATLILEEGVDDLPDVLERVGELERIEANEVVTGYAFDLQNNSLTSQRGPNPSAGRVHRFVAYKIKGQGKDAVKLAAKVKA